MRAAAPAISGRSSDKGAAAPPLFCPRGSARPLGVSQAAPRGHFLDPDLFSRFFTAGPPLFEPCFGESFSPLTKLMPAFAPRPNLSSGRPAQ